MMGLLVDGEWKDEWYDTKSTDGAFKRQESAFRDWVKMDGSTDFAPEAGRYHLYVSLACPWAHRTLIFRKLKKLEKAISVDIVDPIMLENGWTFTGEAGGTKDTLHQSDYLYQVYLKADPKYFGRVTVPILWDKQNNTIVSNESSEIIRMFNHEFENITDNSVDYYPGHLRKDIDSINEFVYHNINNGVYKCGFATSQEAYESAFESLFGALDKVETILSKHTYLVGDALTEADWRLFTTLVRFDAVYVGHFKCNLKRIADYPNLSNYLSDLYHQPGIAETVNFDHIKRHYYVSHTTINPTGIVPSGPELAFL